MRYELFLRGAAALDEAALKSASQTVAESGPALRWEPYLESSATRGIDVIAELERPGAGRELCRAVFAIAAAQGLTVFDPQMGRPVMEADEEQILAQIERLQAFTLAAPVSQTAGGPRLAASTRLWVAIALVLLGAVALARALSCLSR